MSCLKALAYRIDYVSHSLQKHITNILQCFPYVEISYVLSADSQVMPSRVRLIQEVGLMFTGKINGTLTLMRGQQMCLNTTAIVNVSLIVVVFRFILRMEFLLFT